MSVWCQQATWAWSERGRHLRRPSLISDAILCYFNARLLQEHPCQGASAYLKLVTQPPTQLPVALASLASFADTDSGADGVWVDCDVREDTALRATARCFGLCGLATCFGASTTTLGSELVAPPDEGIAVCDIAVPLRQHMRPATKSDKNLIALSSQMRGRPFPSRSGAYHVSRPIEADTGLRHRGHHQRCTSPTVITSMISATMAMAVMKSARVLIAWPPSRRT